LLAAGADMKEEILELFRLASKFFFKKYKETGGSQSKLAEEFGVTQSYLSSVMNGSRSASFELYNLISEKLYGPLDKFIAAGRRIQDGIDPLADGGTDGEDSVEKLIAQLTYYVMDYKRLQKDMSKQKVFYETIIENLQSGVIVTDKKNKIIFINRYMEKMSGLKANKIVGTAPFITDETILELEMSLLNREYQEALNQLKPVYYEQVPINTTSGQVFYNSGWMIPLLKDNAFDGMICTLRDTTLTQNLSDLLYQSIEQCPEGMWLIQQDTPENVPMAYFANKTFFKIFGLAEISPKPGNVPFLDVVELMKKKIKNAAEWEKKEKDAFASNLNEMKCVIKMKNGEEYQWISKPLVNDNNRHIGRFATVKKMRAKTASKKK
jgi:PAS domain S-box-containing protein